MADAPDVIPDVLLADLKRRLEATRRVLLPAVGWQRGTDPDYLAELIGYWAHTYDWRPHEDRIRALPWVGPQSPECTRVVHQRAADPTAPVVVLLHGWPDSVLRFEKVLPQLTDVHVVAPCLPGYPFAEPLSETGMSTTAMARVVAATMASLGYDRYVVSGGDVGGGVAEALAVGQPEHVTALHLTDIPFGHLLATDPGALTSSERAYLAAGQEWQRTEGGYQHQQSTRPHTLAAALGDSPAGLAAWIVEKLRAWSDCQGHVESVFPREELLTWVMAYWVTATIGTSFTSYVEPRDPVGRVPVPTAVTIFPHDLVRAPREFAERYFDIGYWDEPTAGGHFAAWEQPDAFVTGVRAALALAR